MIRHPREQTVTFGDGMRLVGTVTFPAAASSPTEPDPGAIALVLFNAGVIPRLGPHRLNVKMARRAAQLAIPALRFDLSGLGDSLPSMSNLGFEKQSVADVRASLDEMSERSGITRFVLFGICSGAVLSYAAALEDTRVVGCIMLDPYMYPTRRTHLIRMLARLRERGIFKLASGWLERQAQAGVRLFQRTGAGRRVANNAPAMGLGLQKPPQQEFAAGLNQLIERGVELMMIYSGSVLYTYNYANQFHDGFRRYRLGGRVQADFLPGIDHTVTEIMAQQQLIDHLLSWIVLHFPISTGEAR